MENHTRRLAVYPGTFDPLTNGHLDVIRRGAGLFDELLVAVGDNPEKKSLLTQDERVQIIRQAAGGIANVRVEPFTGLTVQFARRAGACAILRGIRNSSDLQFEYQVAMTNRAVTGIETVFIIPSTEFAFTSSTLIKQIAQMGGDISGMVPPQVLPYVRARCGPPAADATLREHI